MAEVACSSSSSDRDEGLCHFKCHCWDEIDLVKLVAANVKPRWWMDDFRICYNLLNEVFDCASRCEGSQEKTSRAALLTLDASLTLPSYMKNLKRTARNNVLKKPHTIVTELYKENQEFVGPECERNGITRSVLNDILKEDSEESSVDSNAPCISTAEKNVPKVILKNRLVLELEVFRSKMNKTWKEFLAFVLAISLSKPNIEEKSLRKAVERLRDKKQDLLKHQQTDKLKELLNDEFKLPQKRMSLDTSEVMDDSAIIIDTDPAAVFKETVNKYAAEIEYLVSSLEQSDSEVQLLRETARELSLSGMDKTDEILNLRNKLADMKHKHTDKSIELKKAMEKLGALSTRNVNKKIKRRNDMVAKLKVKTNEQKKEIQDIQEQKTLKLQEKENEFEKIIDEKNEIIAHLNGKLDAALAAKAKSQKLKWYYKEKSKHSKHKENEGHLLSKISELKSRISELENDVESLQEKIEIFLESPSVKTFQDGKYTDEVRTVYEDLLCWGVGVENVEKIVRTVIENLGGLQCGRLPKATFARCIYLEARRLAQFQLADEFFDGWDTSNRTLQSDGTSKHGYSYSTFDVTMGDGKVLVAGMRDMSGGTAETQFEVLREILEDIASCAPDEKADGHKKLLKSIKNLMSDRCVVQKRFNELVRNYREAILPQVVEEWEGLSKEEQDKMSRMNDLFCGLHFIVGLADQAEAALKVWDRLLYGDEKVGSIKHGGYSKGESGTYRLVRTVCKAVQAKGCERSGRAVSFLDYVRSQGIETVPLAPFVGNRFNILFHNGGGVFLLYDQLKSFFEWLNEENRLLKAVHHDLQVASFVAGCRALGLIDKFVTGPLWRVIENINISALGMSEQYQQLLKCFEAWSMDATPILKGEGVIFGDIPIKMDNCLAKLIAPSPFWDAMTLQVLELMFGSFVVVTKRMLSDHLEGGKYDKPEPAVVKECKSAPKSNVTPERDFGMLDCLMMVKPNATTMVYEGILMFTKNNTKEWRDSLSPEKKRMVLQLARNSKQSQRQQYIERKAAIRRRREEKLAQAKQEKEKREIKERVQKENLVQKVEELGGLWKTTVEVDQKLKDIVSEKEKKVAIQSQLQFRKTILNAKHPDKTLFQMSTGGKQFTAEMMASNLKLIIAKMDKERESVISEIMPDNCSTGATESEPRIISREKLEEQKKKYKKLAEKEEIKSGKKRSAENLPHETHQVKAKRKRQARQTEQIDSVPTIVTPEDLVGKKVTHYCVGEDGQLDWFEGTVIGIHGGNRNSPDFLIRYVGFEELFLFSYCEFKEGKLKLVSLVADDVVGKRISQRFEDEKHKQSWWENGKVLSISGGSKDNPEFIVEFDYEVDVDEGSDSDEDICTDSEVCSFNLFEDYLNNDLRLL